MKNEIIKTISTSKKKEVLEPSKYYTEIGEKIIKYKSGVNNYYQHYDKKNRLIAQVKKGNLNYQNKKVTKKVINYKFKELFDEMSNFSKSYSLKKSDEEKLKFLKNFYKLPPIIIGGCGRSGTTLLLSILSSHTKIHGIKDETYAFFPYPLRLNKIIYNLKFKQDKLCWLEKTPKNIQVFKKIFKLFKGKVKLINIVRNAKSVIHSKHPNSNKKYYVDLSRWKSDVKMGLKSKKISYTIIFENLIKNPKIELERLCKFLNLKFERRLLNYAKFTSVKQNIAWGNNNVKSIDRLANRNYNIFRGSRIKKYYDDKEAVKLNKYYGFE
jgi:hypothetical protein